MWVATQNTTTYNINIIQLIKSRYSQTRGQTTNINNAMFKNIGRDCGANRGLHPESLFSCYNLAVEQQGGSIQKSTAPKPLDAVAYELVASNLIQGLGLSVPQDWLSSSIPSRGWLSPSGVSSPSLRVWVSVGVPGSASGTAGVGVLQGSSRSTWTVYLVRFTVCLSTITNGDLNNSILRRPVQSH